MGSIRIQRVSVQYPVEGRGMLRILNGIDLEIESGEFVSIVGQTGCGKSTLLRLILGEESPTRGTGAGGWKGAIATRSVLRLRPAEIFALPGQNRPG